MDINNSIFKKLKDWTLSAKVQEALGPTVVNGYDANDFKNHLKLLVEKGILLAEGQRRGLKYKANPTFKFDTVTKPAEDANPEIISASSDVEEEEVREDVSVAQYVKNKDAINKGLKAKSSLADLLEWVAVTSPSTDSSSVSLAFRKASDGSITMKIYNGLSIIKEKRYDEDHFKELVDKSFVSTVNPPTFI